MQISVYVLPQYDVNSEVPDLGLTLRLPATVAVIHVFGVFFPNFLLLLMVTYHNGQLEYY